MPHNLEQKSYHALTKALHGNYEALKKLKEAHGSWEKALHEKQIPLPSDKELEELEEKGIRLILAEDLEFPPLLREIPWTPHALYVRGAPLDHTETMVAIVGTRKATPQGLSTAKNFAQELSRKGITVVSGLALGIDAAAHEATLKANGKTIAVLGNGLDSIYPKQNERLGKQIIEEDGTLISEYPPGTPSLPKNFIERNRIVAGLSKGILVIEAPQKSGSLATARFGIEQNRDIFVVPGSLNHPNFMGSHELIKSGAALVTETKDILSALGIEESAESTLSLQAKNLASLDKEEQIIITVLQSRPDGLSPDAIATLGKLPITTVNRSLSFLSVKGFVREQNGIYLL